MKTTIFRLALVSSFPLQSRLEVKFSSFFPSVNTNKNQDSRHNRAQCETTEPLDRVRIQADRELRIVACFLRCAEWRIRVTVCTQGGTRGVSQYALDVDEVKICRMPAKT